MKLKHRRVIRIAWALISLIVVFSMVAWSIRFGF